MVGVATRGTTERSARKQLSPFQTSDSNQIRHIVAAAREWIYMFYSALCWETLQRKAELKCHWLARVQG